MQPNPLILVRHFYKLVVRTCIKGYLIIKRQTPGHINVQAAKAPKRRHCTGLAIGKEVFELLFSCQSDFIEPNSPFLKSRNPARNSLSFLAGLVCPSLIAGVLKLQAAASKVMMK